MKNVVTEVVREGLCVGCGLCAGLGRAGCLEMVREGAYHPQLQSCRECGQCLAVCPALDSAAQVSAIRRPVGEMLSAWVGHSLVPEERERGSSGALATRLLQALLARGEVAGVIAVCATGRPQQLFEPRLLRSAEEIAEAAGSKYYPVEFSQALRQIEEAAEPYALVGLPCVIRGLRRAQERLPWLKERLPYLFALTCGRGTTSHYTDLLAYLAGLGQAPLAEAQYRVKAGARQANDFIFRARSEEGQWGRPLPFNHSPVHQVWSNWLLMPPGCFACADLFGGAAEATFMDAWLPEYLDDTGGNSIVIARSARIERLLHEEERAGRVALSPLEEARVLASQAGALRRKRQSAWHHPAARRLRAETPAPAGRGAGVVSAWWRLRNRFSLACLRGPRWRRRPGMSLLLACMRGQVLGRVLSWPLRKLRSWARSAG